MQIASVERLLERLVMYAASRQRSAARLMNDHCRAFAPLRVTEAETFVVEVGEAFWVGSETGTLGIVRGLGQTVRCTVL
jgi:hypothetical protein